MERAGPTSALEAMCRDLAFHRTIWSQTGNEFLERTLNSLTASPFAFAGEKGWRGADADDSGFAPAAAGIHSRQSGTRCIPGHGGAPLAALGAGGRLCVARQKGRRHTGES